MSRTNRSTKAAPVTLEVGQRVRLLKATRHNMIPAGEIGVVVEIRATGSRYTDGVSVEFMRKPSPQIARMFGKNPNEAEPFRCLFPAGTRLPLEVVG